jgi:hypothetical protein
MSRGIPCRAVVGCRVGTRAVVGYHSVPWLVPAVCGTIPVGILCSAGSGLLDDDATGDAALAVRLLRQSCVACPVLHVACFAYRLRRVACCVVCGDRGGRFGSISSSLSLIALQPTPGCVGSMRNAGLASVHVCTRACMRVGVSPRGICSCLWTTRPRTHPFHAAQLAGVAKAVKWNSLSPSSSFSADYREMWSLPVRRDSAAALRSIASDLARLATPPHPTPPHPTPPHPTPPHRARGSRGNTNKQTGARPLGRLGVHGVEPPTRLQLARSAAAAAAGDRPRRRPGRADSKVADAPRRALGGGPASLPGYGHEYSRD